jgi:predicted O-linked N-acetylglucosamine transferase (SPINDLY family)
VELWAGALNRIPGSRLVLKAKQFADAGVTDGFRKRFAGKGIDPSRIELLAFSPSPFEHLALYEKIDIALDTTPYNGTTTTIESLLMGVPVIALAGAVHASRVGMSLLKSIGLSNLIADSPGKFADLAAYLASEPDRLRKLRPGLRNALGASALCNAPAFTRDLEAAYRDMWHTWCNRQR